MSVVSISDYRLQTVPPAGGATRTKYGKFKADMHKVLAEFAALVDAGAYDGNEEADQKTRDWLVDSTRKMMTNNRLDEYGRRLKAAEHERVMKRAMDYRDYRSSRHPSA